MTAAAEPIHVHFETDRFVLRSLSAEDASDRWAGWIADPLATSMLGVRPYKIDIASLQKYIAAVDQQQKLMLGIFLLSTKQHIGVITVKFLDQRRRMEPKVLIGEAQWRNAGVLNEVANAVGTYFFETFGLEAIVASVPAHNAFMQKYLEDREWQLVRKMPGKRRADTEPTAELLVYEFPRSLWLDRKKRGFFGGPAAHADA